MATAIKRGLASVTGIAGTLDVVIYPVAQSVNISQNFEEEVVKDVAGFDAAWVARNHHYLADWKFKLLGDTAAHAKTGGTFLAPYATVTLSGFDLTVLNTTWQNISGAAIDLNNTSVADFQTKFLAFIDAEAANLRHELAEKKDLTDELDKQLKDALTAFKSKMWKA